MQVVRDDQEKRGPTNYLVHLLLLYNGQLWFLLIILSFSLAFWACVCVLIFHSSKYCKKKYTKIRRNKAKTESYIEFPNYLGVYCRQCLYFLLLCARHYRAILSKRETWRSIINRFFFFFFGALQCSRNQLDDSPVAFFFSRVLPVKMQVKWK